jgi:sirohydrochlorin ferrochelatase
MAPSAESTAVLLIAHGSRHAPANDDLHELAARFAAQGDHPIVEPSFLELAQPDIATAGDRCVARGARRVLMVPYFLSAGVHLLRDLTAARDALRKRHPGIEFRLGPPLGPDPLLDRLVALRIRQTDTADEAPAFATSEELTRLYVPEHCADDPHDRSTMARIDTNRAKD